MIDSPPYALVIDCDSEARRLAAASLGEAGFVVAGFAHRRGALAALAVRPADLAVIAGRLADGNDAFAAARQLRHCQSGLKVLFTASAGFPPAAGGLNDGYVVTRPFDRRRFLGSVLELVARGEADAGDRRAAELGLVEAELACLASRFAAAERTGAQGQSQHLSYRIRDAVAARQAWLLSAAAPDEAR
jgi:DNA-binding response OmpR family regulator